MKYPPALTAPIEPLRRPNLFEDIQKWEKDEADRIVAERTRKLDLLFDHYRIPSNDSAAPLLLLHAMIEAHVPGWRVGVDRSRKRKPKYWTKGRELSLGADVEMLVAGGMTIAAACRRLDKAGAYRNRSEPTSLRRRFEEARRRPTFEAFRMLASRVNDPAEAWALFKAFAVELLAVEADAEARGYRL